LSSGVIEEKYSYVATFEEIQENEFNLNIPRYVDTFEEEEEVDIKAVQKEIDQLNTSLIESEATMQKYITDLGF
jgi:type I restriction enzyme M protein